MSKALAAISTTIEMGGQPSPIYKTEKNYKVPVAQLIEGFKREDPPSTPQLAVPVSVPNQCFTLAYRTKNEYLRAQGDLAIIAYYYLLRTGEYTKPKTKIIDGKTKRLIHNSLNSTIETQMELETKMISESAETSDGQNGIQAFLKKEKPKFEGK